MKKSELLNLFLEKKAFQNDKFPKLSKAMQYFKEDRNGVSEVCTLVEEFAEEYAKKYAKECEKAKTIDIAKKLISRGMTTKDITEITYLTEEEVEVLRAEN
ncbi:MAG: hypothetical protein ACI4EK_03785 [Wujia sp.]